jgi:hypothetical protein
MARMQKPHVATLAEITIVKNGDYAEIAYHDPKVGGVSLKIGPEVAYMSDQEILDCHNRVIRAMQHSVATYKHRAVEVPVGSPQVEYSERCDQWVPRGDVLRCLIHDDEERRPVIEIDDREFTLEEFGTMLTTFTGWGMRIVFVPDNDLEKPPVIVVKNPKD